MSASLMVPQFIKAKSEKELQLQLRKIQAKLAAKVQIVSIVYKPNEGEWVLWYMIPMGQGIVTGI